VTVGREIRRIREAKGWGQAKLAMAAGTSVSAVSQIETGARNPSAVTLEKVAVALGVEVADLFPKVQARLPLDATAGAGRGQGQESVSEGYRMAWRDALNALAERWEERVKDEVFTLDAVDEFFLTLWDVSQSVSDAIKAEQSETMAFITEAMQRASTRGAAAHLEEMQATGMTLAASRLLKAADAVYLAAKQRFRETEFKEIAQHYEEAREALSLAA